MARVTIDDFFCKKGAGCAPTSARWASSSSIRMSITAKGYRPARCTDEDKCTGCATCATMCPDVAITVER